MEEEHYEKFYLIYRQEIACVHLINAASYSLCLHKYYTFLVGCIRYCYVTFLNCYLLRAILTSALSISNDFKKPNHFSKNKAEF